MKKHEYLTIFCLFDRTGGHVPPKEHQSKSSEWKNAFAVLIPWKRTSK